MEQMACVPDHVAFIMDGNGRWAQQRGLPRSKGHEAGVRTMRTVINHALRQGIPVISLFAFSCENMGRPDHEVAFLFSLFEHALLEEESFLQDNRIHVRCIGDRSAYPEALKDTLRLLEGDPIPQPKMLLNLAVNYSGRWDILQAVRRLVRYAQAGQGPESIDEFSFSRMLAFSGAGDPDLLVRTGCVQRISNFALWNLAYSELAFPEVLWPDFDEAAFDAVLSHYQQRERRFGLTREQWTQNLLTDLQNATLEDTHPAPESPTACKND